MAKLVITIKGKPKRLEMMRKDLDKFVNDTIKKEKLEIRKKYFPSEYIFTVEGDNETIMKLKKEQKIKTSHKLAMKLIGIKIRVDIKLDEGD